MFRIFFVSILLFFSNLAFGKYLTFLDPKSELIISKYLGKNYLIGSANYSFMFWNIYDAELYSTSNKIDFIEFAVVLKYNHSITKNRLVKETIDDIKEQKKINQDKEKKWRKLLESIYVKTDIGKKFIGIKKMDKAIFYYDDKKIYQSYDQEFNELFFNIWLRNDSKNPEFSKRLLGKIK